MKIFEIEWLVCVCECEASENKLKYHPTTDFDVRIPAHLIQGCPI
jgi:hypothetical protein